MTFCYQIAAKLLSDPLSSSGKLEPWWYKATDVNTRPVDDQNKRLQQQEWVSLVNQPIRKFA